MKWTEVTRVMRAEKTAVRDPYKRTWRVNDKLVAWERPLRKSDLAHLGDSAPAGAILAVAVPLDLKEALVESGKYGYFTTPHFHGYGIVLIALAKMKVTELKRLVALACQLRETKRARAKRG